MTLNGILSMILMMAINWGVMGLIIYRMVKGNPNKDQ